MSWCEFKTLCAGDCWRFLGYQSNLKNYGSGHGRKMAHRQRGAGLQGIQRGGERAVKRCPLCNKRLILRAIHNSGAGEEFSHWEIPAHKPRETKAKSPRRKSARRGRGK